MKTTFKILYIYIILTFLYSTANAQYILKEADKQFDMYNYAKAVKLYTQAYQQKNTLHSSSRLAESYRLLRDYKQAESWYGLLQGMKGAKPEITLWYAKMLSFNGKYSEAKSNFEKYEKLLKEVLPEELKQIKIWKSSCDSAIKWMKSPKPVTVLNEATLNSPKADFGAVDYQNSIVFTSDRGYTDPIGNKVAAPFLKFDKIRKYPNKKIYGATGNAYLKIYQKEIEADSISIFHLNFNGDYHIGTPVFNAAGDEVYFTSTRTLHKFEDIVKGEKINVEIFSSKKINGEWTDAVPFRYNKVQKWSVGDPFLSPDAKTLYFVSNMPGGKGGTDIYYCKRNDNGEWQDAINFEVLNTPGNERSIALDSRYHYFSTDGLISMGGLDIYRARIKDGVVSKLENLGFPINSSQDDFAYSLTSTKKRFLSSNREGGLGNDDIYSYIDTEKIRVPLDIQILDKETNQPLANAVITITDSNGKPIKIQTDENGKFNIYLDENSDYNLLVDKTNYISESTKISTQGIDIDGKLNFDLALNKIVIEKPIVLENIYYDFNKAKIKPSSFATLNKLVEMLKDNPTLWVELSAHTDNQGDDKYNQWLSEMRAKSAVFYIVKNGIDVSRIKSKGYGESMPIEKCNTCTIKQNQLNRRTEFKIVKQ